MAAGVSDPVSSTHAISWNENGEPVSLAFGDTYFSREDGRAETRHVFIGGNGLPDRWTGSDNFTIGELGFGTGLNFLETWTVWKARRSIGQRLNFIAVEAFPMTLEDNYRALARWPDLAELADLLLTKRREASSTIVEMDGQTTLRVIEHPASVALDQIEGPVDAWYLDGFAPDRNPDMWSDDLMVEVADRTAPDGTFATYSSAGWVRRNLEAAGFEVEKRPGFGRKRHMLAGIRKGVP